MQTTWGDMTERGEGHRTFERDNNDFLLSIPTPLLHLSKRIDKHTRINNNNISFFDICLLDVFGPTILRREWTLLLLVLLMRIGGGDPDTADGELTTFRVGRRL